MNKQLAYYMRRTFIMPALRRRLKVQDFSIVSDNCMAGFLLHDLGQRFDTPTVNMLLRGSDYYEFVENLEWYLSQEIVQAKNPLIFGPMYADYPCGLLRGGAEHRDLIVHFGHVKTYEEAAGYWEKRRKRVHWDRLIMVYSFRGHYPPGTYERVQALPVKNKLIFVDQPVDPEKFPDFHYISGMKEGEFVFDYQNSFGKRFYDQFDIVGWINEHLG